MKPVKAFALKAGAAMFMSVCFSASVAQAGTAGEKASSDELVVYAAILDSLSKLDANSHFLIADKTSTFACGEADGNGLSVGGCNGLRTSNETPADRLAIVVRDLPELRKNTLGEFLSVNQQCASIAHKIPSSADYHLFNDSDIPKTWKYSFLVYLSRVGFNPEHTEALVNVGLFSYADGNLSEGYYVVLRKLAGKWTLGGTSAVWKLTATQ